MCTALADSYPLDCHGSPCAVLMFLFMKSKQSRWVVLKGGQNVSRSDSRSRRCVPARTGLGREQKAAFSRLQACQVEGG